MRRVPEEINIPGLAIRYSVRGTANQWGWKISWYFFGSDPCLEGEAKEWGEIDQEKRACAGRQDI